MKIKKLFLGLAAFVCIIILTPINAANQSNGQMFFNLDQQAQSNNTASQQQNTDKYGRDAMFNTGEDQAETEWEKSKTRNLLIAGGAILGAGAIAAAIILLHNRNGGKGPTPPTPGDKLIIAVDTQNQHLQYRAIDVINQSTVAAYDIDNIVLSDTSDYAELKLCGIDQDANCDAEFKSTCQEGETLNPTGQQGSSCKIWIHAEDGINPEKSNLAAPLGKGTETLKISAENTENPDITVDKTFNITYRKDLYVGGRFQSTNNSNIMNIARWNGPAAAQDSAWQAFGAGLGDAAKGDIKALYSYKGDLIAGGLFSKTGTADISKNIALWNGQSWQSLGSGLGENPNDDVRAIIQNSNGELVAGGLFALNTTDNYVNVAQWDGTSWQALAAGGLGTDLPTSYVSCFINFQDPDDQKIKLFAGGRFLVKDAENNNTYNIAKLDTNADAAAWQAVGAGLGDNEQYVRSFAAYPPNAPELIAAGHFIDKTQHPFTFANTAKLVSSQWQFLGSGVSLLYNSTSSLGQVTSLTYYKNHLLAGGNFNWRHGSFLSNDQLTTNVAKWDYINFWTVIGSISVAGLGDRDHIVYSLTTYPVANEEILAAGGSFDIGQGLAWRNEIIGSSTQPWQSIANDFKAGSTIYALAVMPSIESITEKQKQ